MTVSYKALYEIRLQSLKCNAKRACIFYLILVVISSSLTLPINSREGEGTEGLLNGQNPTSLTEVICRWSLRVILYEFIRLIMRNNCCVEAMGFWF